MSEERLPLEILKDKYIPIEDFPERYGISVAKIKKLIDNHEIRYAEFRITGSRYRTPHCNPEDVLAVLKERENS